MSGPVPKPAATRQRRNKTSTARTLTGSGEFAIPTLPPDCLSQTVAWWATVLRSPMKDEYTEADWHGLLAVADTFNRYWLTGDSKILAEFRMQCREYGLTPMARRSLQWEIARGEDAQRRMSQSRAPRPTNDPRLRVVDGTRDTGKETALADARARRRAMD